MPIKTCTYFILLILCYNVSEGTNHFRYDYNYHEQAGGWLKLHRIPATWRDAWLRCHFEGAILASPINSIIQTAIKNEMIKSRGSMDEIFSGFHSTFSKGDFFSVDGVPLNRVSLQWMPREPDNKNNDEDCILFSVNGTIADAKCNEVHPYMCYKKESKNMIVNDCGTVDNEYSLDPNTGSCYKFHRVAQNWTRAFMTCAAEGAHLAVINSETEANVLREIFTKHPRNSIRANVKDFMRDVIHVGFHDWSESGIWTTIHGNSLMEAGFDLWAEDQPNYAEPGQYCGSVFRDGRLNDVWCHERAPFICEKPPVFADFDAIFDKILD